MKLKFVVDCGLWNEQKTRKNENVKREQTIGLNGRILQLTGIEFYVYCANKFVHKEMFELLYAKIYESCAYNVYLRGYIIVISHQNVKNFSDAKE